MKSGKIYRRKRLDLLRNETPSRLCLFVIPCSFESLGREDL